MTYRLFGAKSFSESTLAYCKLDPWEQTLVKFKNTQILICENELKYRQVNGNLFYLVSRCLCISLELSKTQQANQLS